MKKIARGLSGALLMLPMALHAQDDCNKSSAGNIGASLWKSGSALGFAKRGLAVDADGAPNSYRVDGNGLSYTCDGVFGVRNGIAITQKNDPAGWQKICQSAWANAQKTKNYTGVKIVGFAKHTDGRPMIQQAGDPLPSEAYISSTSMTVPGAPAGTQRRYVNAAEIPYVVLPTLVTSNFGMAYGDVALLYRPKTGAMAYGIYADCCGPGEASVKLHLDLKNNPIILRGGIERAKAGIADDIVTIMFPGKHPEPSVETDVWYKNIQDVGKSAFDAWGGVNKLKACAG